MDNEREYALKPVKLFLDNEVKSVIEELGIDVEVTMMTNDEYFNSDIYKNYCANGLREYADKLGEWCGFYSNNELIILLENHKVGIGYTSQEIISLLITIFHELGHYWQDNEDVYHDYFNLFCESIEHIVINDNKFYIDNWQSFYIEAEADLYGISVMMEILKKYPHLYKKNEDWIEYLSLRTECRINTYDFNFIFNKFNSLDKTNHSNTILRAIYKDNMQDFNSIEEINANFRALNFADPISPILSSDAFLKTFDFDNLNDNEINIMIDALESAWNDIIGKINFLEDYIDNHVIDDSDDYDDCINKCNYFYNRLDVIENFIGEFNYLRKKGDKLYLKKVVNDKKPDDC